jgi:hypothetical protein
MLDYAVPCPSCNFVLRFHDPSLFGRKARCPQCHSKFLLAAPAERTRTDAPPATRTSPVPAAAAAPAMSSTTAPAALAAGAHNSSEHWLSEGMSCGFRVAREARRVRWTLPDPLRISHAAAIALGAVAGASAALLWPSGPTPLISSLAAVAGGLAGAGLLAVRLR